MIRDIFLHGAAGRAFGRHFRLDVASPAEAVRALISLRPGLRAAIRAGWWRVIVGPPRIRNGVPADCLLMNMGAQPLHLVPATPPAGGGDGKSIGSIILGTVLIIAGAVASYFGQAWIGVPLITTGISMIAGGIAGLLTTTPKSPIATEQANPNDRPSFLFNGVTNNSQQGGPVPLVFGTHLVGSIVVSAGLNTEWIQP
jgi:predicted phage tail protein